MTDAVLVLNSSLSVQAERDAISIEGEEAVGEYARLQQAEAEGRSLIRSMVVQPRHALPFLQPGRLARVLTNGADRAPAGQEDSASAHEVLQSLNVYAEVLLAFKRSS